MLVKAFPSSLQAFLAYKTADRNEGTAFRRFMRDSVSPDAGLIRETI